MHSGLYYDKMGSRKMAGERILSASTWEKEVIEVMRTKTSDDAWVRSVAQEAGMDEAGVRAVWDAAKRLIVAGVGPDGTGSCIIPGFGTFTRSIHKGHPLNLGVGPDTRIGDYPVLKFRAADSFRGEALGTMKKDMETGMGTSTG